jgi:hypothetical protein
MDEVVKDRPPRAGDHLEMNGRVWFVQSHELRGERVSLTLYAEEDPSDVRCVHHHADAPGRFYY